jgi:hypothetical protein
MGAASSTTTVAVEESSTGRTLTVTVLSLDLESFLGLDFSVKFRALGLGLIEVFEAGSVSEGATVVIEITWEMKSCLRPRRGNVAPGN